MKQYIALFTYLILFQGFLMVDRNLYARAAASMRVKSYATKDFFGWLKDQVLNKGEDILESIFDRRKKGTVWIWKKDRWVLAAELHDEYFSSALIEDMARELSVTSEYSDTLILGVRLDQEHQYYLNGKDVENHIAMQQIRKGEFTRP